MRKNFQKASANQTERADGGRLKKFLPRDGPAKKPTYSSHPTRPFDVY